MADSSRRVGIAEADGSDAEVPLLDADKGSGGCLPTCARRAYVCTLVALAAAGAALLATADDAPADAVAPDSAMARCGCPEFLGTTILTPMYVLLLSQFWVVCQTGLVGFGMSVLKRGFQGARTWVQVCGGPGLFVATCVVDCSRVVWVGFLLLHTSHFLLILIFNMQRGLPVATAFHETYFTFVNSGAVTFCVFATLGSYATEALVRSAARLDAFQSSHRAAAGLMAKLDANGDGFVDDEELEPYFEFGLSRIAGEFGCDPDVGLDLEGLRKLAVFMDPVYDWDIADEIKSRDEGTTGLDPADLILCGVKKSHIYKKAWNARVVMVGCGDHDGMPAWACPHPVDGWKQLKSQDGVWTYVWGDKEGTPAPDTAPAPHEGRAPQDCWPEFVAVACLADLQATPTFATMKLKAESKRSAAAREQRSTFVLGTMAVMLAPVIATHIIPGAFAYSFIVMALGGFSILLLCVAVGFCEVYGDLVHSNWKNGGRVEDAAGFEGYDLPAGLRWLARPYSALAGRLRTHGVILRLALMNMALAGLSLCFHLCFNYAMMHYMGRPYWGAPIQEFEGRKIACVACMKGASSMHALNTLSWLV